MVERSGDVIPKVVRVKDQGRARRPFRMPVDCPVCGSPVVREAEEVVARCLNVSCPARLKESILHFAHRTAMNIDVLGDWLVGKLVDKERVRGFADLYRLRAEDLEDLEKETAFGAARAEKLVKRLAEVKAARGPALVLRALGIPGLGPKTAERVARALPDLARLADTAFGRSGAGGGHSATRGRGDWGIPGGTRRPALVRVGVSLSRSGETGDRSRRAAVVRIRSRAVRR